MGGQWLHGLAVAQHEIMLFAAVGLIVGGLDDLLFDSPYLFRQIPRRAFIYSRYTRMTSSDLPAPRQPGRLAIFVPAWDEAHVIGATLRAMLARWGTQDFRIFVGTYPNDPATIRAVADVAASDARVRLVVHTDGIM